MLYFDLMFLCGESESGFYYTDQEYNGRKYRIFLYRITSYTWWTYPNATYGRGTVFDITDVNAKLVSLCMEKFFNVGENPLAPAREDLTPDNIRRVIVKSDGSLITVFRALDGSTVLKSKGSFGSEQVQRAREIYQSEDFRSQRYVIERILDDHADEGVSVNLEYTAPENLIVVRYDKPELQMLNVVLHDTGIMYSMTSPENVVEEFDYDDVMNWDDREGVVVYMKERRPGEGSQAVKLKSNWYLSMHRVRDEITNPVKVATAVMNGGIDDIRTAFPEFMDWVNMIEKRVVHDYNRFMSVVDHTVDRLKTTHRYSDQREYKKAVALDARDSSNTFYDDDPQFAAFMFSCIMANINGKNIDSEKTTKFFSEQCKEMTVPAVEKMKL